MYGESFNRVKYSCKRVPRTLTNGTLAEQEQNRTDMEQVRNGYRMDTERERERVRNGNRTRSVKRSLLGFF